MEQAPEQAVTVVPAVEVQITVALVARGLRDKEIMVAPTARVMMVEGAEVAPGQWGKPFQA